jgi:hypothetical protein
LISDNYTLIIRPFALKKIIVYRNSQFEENLDDTFENAIIKDDSFLFLFLFLDKQLLKKLSEINLNCTGAKYIKDVAKV